MSLIHRYQSNGYNIVLDINSGCIHLVDSVTYEVLPYIEEGLSAEAITEKLAGRFGEEEIRTSVSECEKLKEEGMLFTGDIYENVIDEFSKNRQTVVKALCLHIAHDCNLACRYCFAEEGEYHGRRALMSFEVGKKALDFLIANSGSRRNLEVDFFGGEPLMNWDVVKELVRYGREQEKLHNKKFRFTLTTNGVLLNDEVMEFCNREMSNVVLSVDGRKEVHDYMRPFRKGAGSYDLIMPKFIKFAESRNQENYYVRGTFTHHNLDFSKDVLHLADLGFKQISVEPVVAADTEEYAIRREDIPKILEEYDILAKEMIKREKEGKGFNFFHFMIDLTGGPVRVQAAFRMRIRHGISRGDPVGRSLSLPSVRGRREVPHGKCGRRNYPSRRSRTNLRTATFIPRRTAGSASPDFTAAADARPTHGISRTTLKAVMRSDANFSGNAWSARS